MKECRDLLFRVGCVLSVLVPFIDVDRPVLFLHAIVFPYMLADAAVVQKDHHFEKIVEHRGLADGPSCFSRRARA